MSLTVYAIRNKLNGKIYVGKTVRGVDVRFKEHLSGKNSTLLLKRTIEKHGRENFETYVLNEAVTYGHLTMMEMMYIKLFRSNDKRYGYNLTEGGDGLVNPSEDTLKKMRKPHVMSEVGLKGLKEALVGNKRASNMSNAKRKKLSKLMSKKRKKWGNKYCGHGFSDESREKMSKSRKKYLESLTKKERSRIFGRSNQNLLGYVHSEETRRKISEGTKRGMYIRSLAA